MRKVFAPAVIDQKIYFIRGMRVMLDSDLAELYGVGTKVLNQAVKRNRHRFPEDFMFRLTLEEAKFSRSQNVTLKRGENIKYAPYAFTEHGAVMLATILRSKTAVEVSVEVVRAFIRLRNILSAHKELARKLEQFEKRYDAQFREVFEAIRKLMNPPLEARKKIGFEVQ